MNVDRQEIVAWCEKTFGHENIVSATFGVEQVPTAVITPAGDWRLDDVNAGVVALLGVEGQAVSGVDLDPDGVTVYYADGESEWVGFDVEDAA